MLGLSSPQNIFNKASLALKRFPLVMLCAIALTVLLVRLMSEPYDQYKNYTGFYEFLQCLSLGPALFLSMDLFNESRNVSSSQRAISYGIAVALLTIFYFALPKDHLSDAGMGCYFLFMILLHLLVFFAPAIGRRSFHGFWLFVKILFRNFFLATLRTCILFLILALLSYALGLGKTAPAVTGGYNGGELFTLDISSDFYIGLFIALAGVFNTWIFLGMIPNDLRKA